MCLTFTANGLLIVEMPAVHKGELSELWYYLRPLNQVEMGILSKAKTRNGSVYIDHLESVTL
jgi:hypothetical protein